MDNDIAELLRLLALYALEPSTHLVIEYLIRRYRIHEMNSNMLLQAMLVAHDAKVFDFLHSTFFSYTTKSIIVRSLRELCSYAKLKVVGCFYKESSSLVCLYLAH